MVEEGVGSMGYKQLCKLNATRTDRHFEWRQALL
jgi:hypothetical protein